MSVLGIILLVLAVGFMLYCVHRIDMTPFTRNVVYICFAVLALLFVLWLTGLLSGAVTEPIRLR